MPSSLCQDCVDGLYTICKAKPKLNLRRSRHSGHALAAFSPECHPEQGGPAKHQRKSGELRPQYGLQEAQCAEQAEVRKAVLCAGQSESTSTRLDMRVCCCHCHAVASKMSTWMIHAIQEHVCRQLASHMCDHVGKGGTCRCLDLNVVDRLHEARGGHEEGAVAHPPGCGDDLTPTPVQGLTGHSCIQDLELDVPDGLITQRALP